MLKMTCGLILQNCPFGPCNIEIGDVWSKNLYNNRIVGSNSLPARMSALPCFPCVVVSYVHLRKYFVKTRSLFHMYEYKGFIAEELILNKIS